MAHLNHQESTPTFMNTRDQNRNQTESCGKVNKNTVKS